MNISAMIEDIFDATLAFKDTHVKYVGDPNPNVQKSLVDAGETLGDLYKGAISLMIQNGFDYITAREIIFQTAERATDEFRLMHSDAHAMVDAAFVIMGIKYKDRQR